MFAFIHIPKTAGSTISSILRHSFRTRHCDVRLGDDFLNPALTARSLRRIGWVYWRLCSIAGHGVVPHTDLRALARDVRFYTFVREPLVRCASEYQYLVQRDGLTAPFDTWIETPNARNRMTKKICGKEDASAAMAILEKRVGFVGLVERFDESLVLLRSWFGVPALDIRYRAKNVMADNRVKQRLLGDRTARDRLIHANREDIELHRFVVESLYPRQVSEYGSALADDVRQFVATNCRPRPYPRQLVSLLLRELVYKPLVPALAWNQSQAEMSL